MRKSKEYVEDHVVLLSVHDVCPQFEDEVIALCDELTDIGLSDFTLLVTPFYGMKRSNTFQKHDIFAQYIDSLDLEISLHGFSHFSKSGQMDEFKKMDPAKMHSKIKSGTRLIKESFGHRPYGFIPPMWTAPKRLVSQVLKILEYCVLGNEIHTKSRTLHTSHYLISQGDSRLSYSEVMVELEVGGPVQMAIHPKDAGNTSLFDTIRDLGERLDYNFTSYQSYLHTTISDNL